jgi:gliding motility-associated-like protein
VFNACAPDSSRLSVPQNLNHNYQPARSGSGYAGLNVYWSLNSDAPQTYTEFAETRLQEPLSKGKQYYLEYYTTPFFSTNDDINIHNTFIGSMGLAISDSERNAHDVPNGFYHLKPIFEHDPEKVIDDTSGWTRINGSYRAKGDEEYIIIGNFRTRANTFSKTLPPNNGEGWAYYFIEDAGAYEFNPLADTMYLCPGSSIKLNAHFLDAKYSWSNGSDDSTIVISAAGIYYVDVILDEVTMRDSVVVIAPAAMPREKDTSVCPTGIPLKLTAPLNGNYAWSNGSNDATIMVNQSGTYSVDVTNECGTFPFTWNVSPGTCACEVFVPTVFTPNGDGRNDYFRASHYCNFELYDFYFRVYNRWGEMVYSSFDVNDKGWDGTRKGVVQPLDTYFWTVSYTIKNAGVPQTVHQKGDCILIR